MTNDNRGEFKLEEFPLLPLPPPKVRPDHSVTVAADTTMPFAREIPKDVIDVGQLLTQICGDWPRQERPDPGTVPAKPFVFDQEYQTHSSVCGMLVDPEGYSESRASGDYFSGALEGGLIAMLLLFGLVVLWKAWRWTGGFFGRPTSPAVRGPGA